LCKAANSESKGEPGEAPRGPITRGVLLKHHTLVLAALHAAIANGAAPSTALSSVFRLHFGLDRTPVEWLIWAHYGAGFARDIWLQHIAENPREMDQTRRGALNFRRQFTILRHFDREAMKVVDMSYVGGCSDRDIAGLKKNAIQETFVEWMAVLSPSSLAFYEEPTDAEVCDVELTLQFWRQIYEATSMGKAAQELARLIRRVGRSSSR
jgi:hypothetical protein